MREILLTRGMVAIVDDADYEWLSQWKWCAQPVVSKAQQAAGVKPRFYASRRASRPNRLVFMHREILQTPRGFHTDHINRDTLDNRRLNLRIANSFQNAANQSVQVRKKLSQFKGVAFVEYLNKTNPWMAYINHCRKRTYLGYFPSEAAAALAYNDNASRLFGEFACLNQVEIRT